MVKTFPQPQIHRKNFCIENVTGCYYAGSGRGAREAGPGHGVRQPRRASINTSLASPRRGPGVGHCSWTLALGTRQQAVKLSQLPPPTQPAAAGPCRGELLHPTQRSYQPASHQPPGHLTTDWAGRLDR